MKSLDRYILRQILLPSILAFILIAFLGVSSELRSHAQELPQGFLTPKDLIYISLFLLPSLITLLVPIAYFLGILMAFGRLAQQGEITAMQAAGISLKRMILPSVVVGILMSTMCFVVQDRLQPWSISKAFHVMYDLLPQRVTIDALDEGELHEYQGLRVFFARKDTTTHTLYDFDLIQPGNDGVFLFHAESAQLTKSNDEYTLLLKNGFTVSDKNLRLNFGSINKPFPNPNSIVRKRFRRESLNLAELFEYEKYITEHVDDGEPDITPKELHKVRYEIAQRASTPFTALAIALIGAPLGVRARRKGKTSLFSIGFGVMLLYYTLMTVAIPTSLSDLSTYLVRAWLPNLMLITMGLVLFWKADRV